MKFEIAGTREQIHVDTERKTKIRVPIYRVKKQYKNKYTKQEEMK